MSTLVTVPVLRFTADIVISPTEPLTAIPLPALILVTPVFSTVIVPVSVIGLPEIAIPLPTADNATLVTVPVVTV